MIIETISSLSKGRDVIQANKLRINLIKDVIKNSTHTKELFEQVGFYLESGEVQLVQALFSNSLFFEKIESGAMTKLYVAYANLNDVGKHELIDNLRESYCIRGIKGFRFSCMPIIDRRVK